MRSINFYASATHGVEGMLRVLSGDEKVRFLFRKQGPYSFYLPNLNTQCFWPKGSPSLSAQFALSMSLLSKA